MRLVLVILLVGNIQSDLRVPLRTTRPEFATPNYGLAVRVPRGLYYCRIPEAFDGPDHGRSFYLSPPTTCDDYAQVGEKVPRLELYYGYNVAEARFPDGWREARTAEELAREACRRPHRLPAATLLGQPAIGCETQKGKWIELTAMTPYDLDKKADAEMSVRLTTTIDRFAVDRAVFNAFVSGVYQCAARWEDETGEKVFWVGAAPGRPECPDGFW